MSWTELLILAAVGLWPLLALAIVAAVAIMRRPGATMPATPPVRTGPLGRPATTNLGRHADIAQLREDGADRLRPATRAA